MGSRVIEMDINEFKKISLRGRVSYSIAPNYDIIRRVDIAWKK